MQLTTLDWTLIVGYFALALGVGLWASKQAKTDSAGYFLAAGLAGVLSSLIVAALLFRSFETFEQFLQVFDGLGMPFAMDKLQLTASSNLALETAKAGLQPRGYVGSKVIKYVGVAYSAGRAAPNFVTKERIGAFAKRISLIDRFKRVNDTHGHLEGDRILRRVAQIAGEYIREGDVVGRVGGEEFVWIIPGVNQLVAEQMAERLRQAIAQGSGVGAVPNVTISVGLAQLRPGDTSLSVFSRADNALYAAKDGGRNLVKLAA